MRQWAALQCKQECQPSPTPPSTHTNKHMCVSLSHAGYRLINGEGDLLPGLVCDVYGNTAVLKLDGEGPAGFYDATGIAEWLQKQLPIEAVFLKNK